MKYRLKIGKRIGIIEYDTKEEALKRAECFKAYGKKSKGYLKQRNILLNAKP